MLDAIFSYFENSTTMLKLIVNIDIHLYDRKNKVENKIYKIRTTLAN